MRFLFTYCFFILLPIPFLAQEIVFNIFVKDRNFETAIENATVFVFKTKENYSSNKEGVVVIKLKGSSFIEISHPEYKSQKIRLTPNFNKEIEVLLEPKIKQLEEVIVTQKHPQEILDNLIKNSKKTLTVPATLKIYNKEFYKYNDENVFFSDGLLNFQIYKSSGNIKADILIEQSRSIGLKKPLEDEIWGYNLNFIMEKYYSFGYLEEIMNKKSKKEYYFTLKNHNTNESYQIIEVKPLEEIEKHLYSFKITFDYKKKFILEIEIVIPENKQKLFLTKNDAKNRKINKMHIKQTYIKKENDYYLFNSTENIEYFKLIGKNEVKIEVKNIMHTKRFNDFLFEYKEREMFKQKSLVMSEKNTVITNYWENESGLYMNEEEKKIIDYLEIFTPKNK